jgi:zinc protease
VQSLKKNFDKTLALLQERMFNPKFTQQAFDRLKQQTLQSLKAAKGQPATIANNVFAKVNYSGNNILGISQSGTEETVKNITLHDIQSYYENYFTSMDTKVVVVGDLKEAEVLPKLSFLNSLPKKKIVLSKPDATPKVDKTKVYMVDVPKGAQTEFRVGYATGLKWDATGDYYKSLLANFPLGGSFNSRLNMMLREEKGWTYGANSGFRGDEYSGEWRFSSGIRADATDSALAEVMSQVKRYVSSGPTDEELDFMRGAIGQSEALRYETGPQKAAFIRRILDYNLPANYAALQNQILKGMTKDQMLAFSKKYLNPDKMNILLVGDKAKILEGVKKLGYDIVELDADGNLSGKQAF